jgi:uncharacterized membrane protein
MPTSEETSTGIGPQRLEAFSDGVIAIILTIMVLELKVPTDVSFESLEELAPEFVGYVLSFVVVATMWVNHHHMIRMVERVDAVFLWLNIHLLFWMSLVPFTTTYASSHHAACIPIALYGANICAFSIAFFMLFRGVRARSQPSRARDLVTARAARKSWMAITLYGASVGLAFISPWASIAIFVIVPAMYVFPEKKIEEALPRA